MVAALGPLVGLFFIFQITTVMSLAMHCMFNKFFLGVSFKRQFLFQDPASPIMENIIDLHHDTTFFLVRIIIFTSWLIARSVFLFYFYSEKKKSLYLTYNTCIEII